MRHSVKANTTCIQSDKRYGSCHARPIYIYRTQAPSSNLSNTSGHWTKHSIDAKVPHIAHHHLGSTHHIYPLSDFLCSASKYKHDQPICSWLPKPSILLLVKTTFVSSTPSSPGVPFLSRSLTFTMRTSPFFGLVAAAGSALAKVQYAGINIAGLDFGTSTDGSCTVSSAVDPGSDGIAQMQHFTNDDGLNVFRLPVSWQYLVNGNLGGTLDTTNFATYDKLVQGCLKTSAKMCIIDVHNYARWNGGIVGQGGPTNVQFASLWSQIASKYRGNPKVAFGVMNEPVSPLTHSPSKDLLLTSISTTSTSQHGQTPSKPP